MNQFIRYDLTTIRVEVDKSICFNVQKLDSEFDEYSPRFDGYSLDSARKVFISQLKQVTSIAAGLGKYIYEH